MEAIVYRFRTGIAWRDLPACVRPVADRVEATQAVLRRRHLGQDPRPAGGRGRRCGRAGLESSRWTPRSIEPISMRARCGGPSRSAGSPAPAQGAEPSYTILGPEPPDHGLGRSRGGVSSKIHQLVDGRGRPLVIAVTAGQAGDSTMLKPLLAHLAVHRLGPGRPRTRPDALLGDKAYSSRGNRAVLRAKRTKTVIPQPSTRSGTGCAAARPADDRRPSTRSPTAAATSSSAPSTTTSNGADSPPVTSSLSSTAEESYSDR